MLQAKREMFRVRERHPEKREEYTRGEEEYRRERQRPGRQKGKRKER